MKKYILPILALAFVLTTSSCSDEEESARTPSAVVSISKTELNVNETMTILFQGVADQVVVFTGDEGHVYQDYNKAKGDTVKANTGLVVNKGVLTYSYAKAGSFHVVVLASTYDTYSGNNRLTAKYEFDVTVEDNCTTISQLYSSITPNVYYATLVDDVNWVLCVPTKQVYKGKEVALNAKRQRINFDIASLSTQVFVNDVLWELKTYYDLTNTLDIRLEAASGDKRNYKLYTMVYPEFATVSADGANGVLQRDAYDQDLMIYNFANATSHTISFTTAEDIRFCVNGKEMSGNVEVNDKDTYTLVRTHADNANIKATSRVKFTFN